MVNLFRSFSPYLRLLNKISVSDDNKYYHPACEYNMTDITC